jgi:LGFP repeat/Thiol-activated cytolysin
MKPININKMKKISLLFLFHFILTSTLSVGQIRVPVRKTSGDNDIAAMVQKKAAENNLGAVHQESATMRPTSGAGGYFLRFENGWVYYNPNTKSVHIVKGDIMNKWGELGYETGELGFPTSDEMNSDKAGWKRMNTFDKGSIYWNNGQFEVVKNSRLGHINISSIEPKFDIKKLALYKLSGIEKNIIRTKSLPSSDGKNNVKFDSKIVRTSKEKTSGDKICRTEYRKLEVTSLSQDVLNPDDIADLRLGGIYDLDEFKKGNLNFIESARNSISIGIEGIKSITVPKPTPEALFDAKTELLSNSFKVRPAGRGQFYEQKTVNSKSEFNLAAGVSYAGYGVDIAAKLGYNEKSKKNKYLVNYTYPIFTTQVTSGKNYFTDTKKNENPNLVILDKITYGARLLIFYESELSETELKMAFSGEGWGVKANLDTQTKNELNKTEYKVFLYGSSGSVKTITGYDDLFDKTQQMLDEITNPNKKNPLELGAPISYSLKFLNGDTAATNCNANEIPSEICTNNPNIDKDFKVVLESIQMEGGNNYGWVDFEIIVKDGNSMIRKGDEIKTAWIKNRDQATYQNQGSVMNPLTELSFENISASERNNGYLRVWTRLQNRKKGGPDVFLLKSNSSTENEGLNGLHGDYQGQFQDIKLSDFMLKKPNEEYVTKVIVRTGGTDKKITFTLKGNFN